MEGWGEMRGMQGILSIIFSFDRSDYSGGTKLTDKLRLIYQDYRPPSAVKADKARMILSLSD